MSNTEPGLGENGYQVTEFEGEDPQWMFELATNPAFARIPAENLQKLFERFLPVEVAAGQEMLRQGEAGDYYYLIRQGTARVTRQSAGGLVETLADLKPGQGFGEEALISGGTRNATVTMLEDGLLMRLAAEDFDHLLRLPLVQGLNVDQAIELLRHGAVLVDVRREDEFRQGSLKGAINLPLAQLRARAEGMDRQQTYLIFCDDGRRAATAAFLLAQRGFTTHVLASGVLRTQKKSPPG